MAELSLPWPDTGGVTGDGKEYNDNEWSQVWEALFQELDSSDEGVLSRAWNKLAVSSPAANTIRVATGMALVHGHFYWNDANKDLTPGPAPAGETRKDRCILRCAWTGGSQYTVRAVIKTGTQTDYPTLTHIDDNTWEIPLARYIIDDAGNITDLVDERVYCHFNTMVSTEMLDDLAVTTAKLANDAVTAAKLADDAVDTAAIQNDAVVAAKVSAQPVHEYIFHFGGQPSAGDASPQCYPIKNNITFIDWSIVAPDQGPVGADFIADIHVGALGSMSSIFASADRPKIADGAKTGSGSTFSTSSASDGQYIRAYCDQQGSTTPAEDITLTLRFKRRLID